MKHFICARMREGNDFPIKGAGILLAVALATLVVPTSWSGDMTPAFNSVRFSENEREAVVDLPELSNALRNGADPNWINREHPRHESTLSHFVMMCMLFKYSKTDRAYAECAQAIKTLIDGGARLQPIDDEILFLPIARGRADIVALLLDLGADPIHWPNRLGTPYSPVEEAARRGYQDVVDILVAHGAPSPNGQKVLQGRFVESATSGSLALLKELLTKGAQVNMPAADNETALVNAIDRGFGRCGSIAKALYLLKVGADPNRKANTIGGRVTTPLHSAVWATSFTYIRKENTVCGETLLPALINKGAHVSALDSNGQTPLHIAAELNHVFAAGLLIEAGAKVMPRDTSGKTPLDLATSGEMIKLLKSHGASER